MPTGAGSCCASTGVPRGWVFRYTAPSGKRREMGLGVCHRGSAKQAGASLSAARELAQDAREQLRRGSDPIDARAELREAAKVAEAAAKSARARDSTTLARAARSYHEREVEPVLSTKHGANWIRSLEHHIPSAIWHAPIASITAPDLLTALLGVRSVEDGATRIPETLQRIRQRLDAIFEDGVFHGLCTTNPARAIRRKLNKAIPRQKAEHLLALPYSEAPAFMARLRDEQGIAPRCLEFAVLTAARTAEALTIEWSELDLDAGVWIVPPEKMKAAELHTVYLADRAIDVLKAQRGLDPHYVFPSPVLAGKPMSNMAMLTVLDRMSMRDKTTVHGLCRSTFSTWAYETAAARDYVIEASLAHQEADRVKAAYNRAQYADERKALMSAWGGSSRRSATA